MKAEEIKHKIEKLNAAINHLEAQYYQLAKEKQQEHFVRGKEKTNLVSKWLHQFKSPKAEAPDWHQDLSGKELLQMLASGEARSKALASQLNVYVLNVSIKLARLKAGGHLIMQAEELRQLAEHLHLFYQKQKY